MFTHCAVIWKNTPELRKKLEGLGYKQIDRLYDISKYRCLYTYWHPNLGGCFRGCVSGVHEAIDCWKNEDLFLAIAALRDDSDVNQWFIDDADPYKTWYLCKLQHKEECMQDTKSCHKASIKELTEHFKTE